MNGAAVSLGPLLFALQGRVPDASSPSHNLGIDALRRRDPEAWRNLFEREMPAIHRYVVTRVGTADAEDITSHVFAEAWENAGLLEDRGLPARAWLFGIARNVVNTHRRRWLRKPPEISLAGVDLPQPGGAAASDLIDLAAAVRSLPRSQAEVVMLRFVHGLSLAETAEALHTTVDSIKARQARALAALRDRLHIETHEIGRAPAVPARSS